MGPVIAAFTAAAPKVAAAASLAALVASTVGAYRQSVAAKNAYKYQAQVAANNAQIARWQAEDALDRGQKAEAAHRLRVAQMVGSQRASMAARGLSLDEGSPLDILSSTELMGEIDAITIRDNAAREAWGYRNKANEYTANSRLLAYRSSAESPLLSAGGTFLTEASRVADRWLSRVKDR